MLFYVITALILAVGGTLDIVSSLNFGKWGFPGQRITERSKLFADEQGHLLVGRAIAVLVAALVIQLVANLFLIYEVGVGLNLFCGIWGGSRFISAFRNHSNEKRYKRNYEQYHADLKTKDDLNGIDLSSMPSSTDEQ